MKVNIEATLLRDLQQAKPLFWIHATQNEAESELATPAGIEDARRRLQRFAPYFAVVYPETRAQAGLIESPLLEIPRFREALQAESAVSLGGRLFLKGTMLCRYRVPSKLEVAFMKCWFWLRESLCKVVC